jgi:putative ABC transport system permease protein
VSGPFKILWRQWRSRNLRLMLLSLVIAMATLLSLQLLTTRLDNSVAGTAKELLAADVRVETSVPSDEKIQALLTPFSQRISRLIEFQSMIFTDAADEGQIAQVKAVEAGYPFYGHVLNEQGQPIVGEPNSAEAWINQRLAQRLNLVLGDKVDIGEAQFRISAIFTSEPDNPQGAFAMSSRVLINYNDVARTQSISPGARVNYTYLLLLKPNAQPALEKAVKPQLDAHTRLVTLTNYRSNSQDFIQRMSTYLLLAGALGVMLSGVALAIAAQEYTAALQQPFALLKTFGMGPVAVAQLFLRFGLVFFVIAAVLAVALGLISQQLLLYVLKNYLANTTVTVFKPLFSSLLAGFILLLAFVSVPVWQLWRLAPAASLREQKLKMKSALLPGFFAVFIVMGVLTQAWLLTACLCIGSAVLVLLVALGAQPLIIYIGRLGQYLPKAWAAGFLALKRHRKGNRFLLAVLALLLVPVIVMAQLRSRLVDAWQLQLPSNAANYFLFNIYAQDKPAIEQWLANQHVEASSFYPMWRARITAINQLPIAEAAPEEQNNPSIRREINLTTSAQLPAGNEIKSGRWWQVGEEAELLISIEERTAQTLNIKIDDHISLSLAGETVEAKVSSIRSVRWDNLAPNFFLITNKPPQSELSANWITSLYIPESQRAGLISILKQFPNITAIDVAQTLNTFRLLIHKLSQAVELVWVFMLVAGLIVLFASVQASLPSRRQEVALLRVAGASRRYVVFGVVGEFFILGLVAAVTALIVSEAILYWLQVRQFKLDYQTALWPWVCVPLLGSVSIAVLGGFYCRQLVSVAPAAILREQSR